jgi:cellobiose-specific phosphotransferase system component IIB
MRNQTIPRPHFYWRIHSTKKELQLNDPVYVRPKSVKEVGAVGRVVDTTAAAFNEPADVKRRCTNDRSLAKPNQNKTSDHRITVQVNGVIKRFRPSRLVSIYDVPSNNTTTILLTPDTANYRQLAVAHVRHGDKVLEIGCSTGICTSLVLRRMLLLSKENTNDAQSEAAAAAAAAEKGDSFQYDGKIIAFDTGSDMMNQTQQALQTEFDNLSAHLPQHNKLSTMSSIHKIDAFADPKGAFSLSTQNNKYPDIVLIDIGGNRELEGVTRMIHWVQCTFLSNLPRVIIVKSKELVRELSPEPEDGSMHEAQSWLMNYLQNRNLSVELLNKPPVYAHPLQAPLVMSPEDDALPICRFHNYHKDGCKRFKNGNECELDHEYCHWCRIPGHVARNCPGT